MWDRFIDQLLGHYDEMGGRPGKRERAALVRLFQVFESELLHVEAASLFTFVAQHGPFGDRNPHMGLAAVRIYYRGRGYQLVATHPDTFAHLRHLAATRGVSAADLRPVARPFAAST